jgi:hypothetical protein
MAIGVVVAIGIFALAIEARTIWVVLPAKWRARQQEKLVLQLT